MLSPHPAPTPPAPTRGEAGHGAQRPGPSLAPGLHPAGGGRPYRSVLGAVVADEAAAPRVSLCPAADVVDATLNDQPLVAWQVVPADLLPAEGGSPRRAQQVCFGGRELLLNKVLGDADANVLVWGTHFENSNYSFLMC